MVEITITLFVILCSIIIVFLIRIYIIDNFSPFKENKALRLKEKQVEIYGKKLIQRQIKERIIEEKKQLEEQKWIKRVNERIKQQNILEETKNKIYKNYQVLRTEIMGMPKYGTWKKLVFQKYGDRCEICGSKDNIEIHHKNSMYSVIKKNNINNVFEALECRELWDVDNGSVLCSNCHKKTSSHIESQIIKS